MDITGFAEVVQALAVLVGFGFAWNELRRYRARKERESTLALVDSYQTPEFAQALLMLVDLPEQATKSDLEATLGDDMKFVALLMTTWESLGLLVFRGEVSMRLVDDFFAGPIVISWQKLRPLVEELRQRDGRETYFEWFQWLAERVSEQERAALPIPAHVRHHEWRESSSSRS